MGLCYFAHLLLCIDLYLRWVGATLSCGGLSNCKSTQALGTQAPVVGVRGLQAQLWCLGLAAPYPCMGSSWSGIECLLCHDSRMDSYPVCHKILFLFLNDIFWRVQTFNFTNPVWQLFLLCTAVLGSYQEMLLRPGSKIFLLLFSLVFYHFSFYI